VKLIKENYDYYTQRNNEVDPLISCQVTAMVQALDLAGFAFPPLGEFKQPEDALRDFIKRQGGNPEVHATLSRYTNEWLGRRVTGFSTETKLTDIKADIDNGLPVVLSGSFPGYPAPRKQPLGHIVTMIGYGEEGVTIIDPYGNTLDDWKGSGRRVVLSWERFQSWIKPCAGMDIKWAHRFFR
jgi:hypothetical protein